MSCVCIYEQLHGCAGVCVSPGVCVHVKGELSGCCCVGVYRCGFVFVPGGLGSVSLCEHGATGWGHALCVQRQMWAGPGSRLSPQVSTCTWPGPSVSCGCPMQDLETLLQSCVPDLLGDLRLAAFPLWVSISPSLHWRL